MLKRAVSGSRVVRAGKVPHVCVIGAGFAGLRCAEVLIEKGITVTILEARDRIGGRVYQDNHLGHLVDMGANWIHGTDNNPMLSFANETRTVTSSIGEKTGTYDELGHSMNEKYAEKMSELVWGIIADAFKLSNESSSIPQDRSLKDFFVEKVEQTGLEPKDKKVVLQIAQMWGAFVGDPLDRQSLKYFWLEECIDGENLWVASTYKSILARVAETALSKASVILSTYVSNVQSRDTTSSRELPKVFVTTETSTLEFDEAVITAPLGCLKRNEPSITPPLPPRIARAVANISYGRLEKVYLTFSAPWWDPSPSTDSAKSTFPFFSHFLHPLYAPENPDAWNVELASLASELPAETTHPTLLFYIHGPCATHVTNLITDLTPLSPEYFARLNTFFYPYYSRLPNYVSTAKVCTPTGILATDWQHDPLAGYGSYTNFQVSPPVGEGAEEVELDKDIEALREGMPDRGIWFAGEHTAPFVALGTVTGAWWSGEGVGRRIAEAYGLGEADKRRGRDDGSKERETMRIGKGAVKGIEGVRKS